MRPPHPITPILMSAMPASESTERQRLRIGLQNTRMPPPALRVAHAIFPAAIFL
jgi:hypothetical protein